MALPQSVLPATLAVFMAYNHENFSFFYAILAVLGVVFAHLGMNLFDDYFDYENQNIQIHNELTDNKIIFRAGKCDYLITKKATTRQLFFVASIFLFIALAFGTAIFLHRGNVILYLTLIGGAFGLSYSAKPFYLSYRGLGEIIVGIMFGFLLMTGVFYAACGKYTSAIGIISVSVGLLVTNILFTHSIMDYQPDKHTGKKTLAVLIRSKKAMFLVSCLLNFAPFLLVGCGIMAHYLSFWYLLTFLSLPLAVYLIYLMSMFFRNPKQKITTKWWFGIMENWDKITQSGIDWFMIRWYLARNLTVFFCAFAILATLLARR